MSVECVVCGQPLHGRHDCPWAEHPGIHELMARDQAAQGAWWLGMLGLIIGYAVLGRLAYKMWATAWNCAADLDRLGVEYNATIDRLLESQDAFLAGRAAVWKRLARKLRQERDAAVEALAEVLRERPLRGGLGGRGG